MKKLHVLLLAVLLNLYIFNVIAYADVGPKPSLDIIGINMPDEVCYMDLLINDPVDDAYKNIDNVNEYDVDMINLLLDYESDGWRLAMVNGTTVPLHGDIICDIKNGKCDMNFSYVGVPDQFKIIVVTKSNEVVVSNMVQRKAFQSKVYFDYKTATAHESSIILLYLQQFMMTFIATLIIEGLILLAFGFSLKKNYKAFIMINLITQLLLTFVVISNMLSKGTLTALIIYFPFEIVILLIEVKLFSRFLLEHKKWRRIAYAVTANLLSFIFGVIIML